MWRRWSGSAKRPFEFKLDGARIQIHKGGETVKIFTRQLQEVTDRLPEIVEWTRALPASEFVLEGEAIALRRTGECDAERDPAHLLFFDCLYREGESLLSLPYRERFESLSEVIPPGALIPRIVTSDRDEAEQFQRQALEAGHEGLMAKALEAPDTSGQRGSNWLKLKTVKTLDLVVLAAEWETAAGPDGYRIFIWERAIRKAVNLSCLERPSRG